MQTLGPGALVCMVVVAEAPRSRRTLRFRPQVPPHDPLMTGGGKPSALSVQLMAELVAGVEALHAGGIVHRDLKPLNVLLTKVRRPL